jgi:hypothetical protein
MPNTYSDDTNAAQARRSGSGNSFETLAFCRASACAVPHLALVTNYRGREFSEASCGPDRNVQTRLHEVQLVVATMASSSEEKTAFISRMMMKSSPRRPIPWMNSVRHRMAIFGAGSILPGSSSITS